MEHDGQSISILDTVGLRRLTCGCYEAMKPAYTPAAGTDKPQDAVPRRIARVLRMRPGAGACTLCGSSTDVPHANSHACILALDHEISGLVQRTHTLRKYRAQLLANRTQLYRNILKRSSGPSWRTDF